MFKRLDTTLKSNPTCNRVVDELIPDDFFYYDKDGFELNKAEQKFYRAMRHPINTPILDHTCWQEPWFELINDSKKLMLDHCMTLCRCDYSGEAKDQLQEFATVDPRASLLLQTKAKWGFDMDLNAVADDGTVFEVLHIEYDSRDYDQFIRQLISFENIIKHTDWLDAANRIWNKKDEWQHLKGFDQNDWKARYLLNWKQAEFTEKTL